MQPRKQLCRTGGMFHLLGLLLLVSWISLTATTPSQLSNNELLNVPKGAANYTYVIEIDPESSEAVDNEACHPTPTKPSSVPCKTLDYAFQQNYSVGDSIAFSLVSPDSVYMLTSNTTFQDLTGISIVGNGSASSLPVVIQCTAPNAGLAFLHSRNIVVRYVRFVGCGAERESTSRDFTHPNIMQMIPIHVTLYFYNCSGVDMYRVEVVNSSQATGVVMYDTNGQILITECTFYNNTAEEDTLGGGGFAVEFTYCSPGDTLCPNDFKEYDPGYRSGNVSAEYNFTDCHFEANIARSQNYTISAANLIFASLANHTAIGRGGGLSIYFKGIARNKSININNCNFTKNSAVWGGGLLMEMDDYTITNKVKVSNCTFTKNGAFFNEDYGTGGGALRVAITLYFWNSTYQTKNYSRNEIVIEHSNFTENRAIQGGAISFSIARQRFSYSSQVTRLLVSECTFDGNTAQLGSAVSGSLYPVFNEGLIAPLAFQSCQFLSNRIKYERNANDMLKSHPYGLGAVYINKIPTTFSDHVDFIGNHGTALTAIGAQVDFAGTHANFSYNTGSTGGALALLGASSILSGPGTSMEFVGNNASLHGGAIYNQYVSNELLKSGVAGDCFFHYSDPFVGPFSWNASFVFSNNSAKKLGNSIYSTAALPCLWPRPQINGGNHDAYDNSIFCNDEQWNFTTSNCSDEIYTEARTISLRDVDGVVPSSPLTVYPGHGFNLPLDAFDDFNHNVTNDTVYAASIQNPLAEVTPKYAYVAHNYISITGKPRPETNLSMSMSTNGYRTVYIKLKLKIEPCPPGFDTDSGTETGLRDNDFAYEDDLGKKTFCKCHDSTVFNGNLRCLEHEFHSQIRKGYWIGNKSKNDTELFMGIIPQYYTDRTNDPYDHQYINISTDYDSIDERVCGGAHRHGQLCGHCRQGYAVAINSRTFDCVPCKNVSIVRKVGYSAAYIALTYLPILGLFFAIIIFNFKLTSSAALSFVLFAQMIGSGVFSLTADRAFYLKNGNIDRMDKAYSTVYGIFNLDSLAFLMPSVCISESLTTLDVLALEYVVAAFPIAIIIIIYLVYRCRSCKCSCYERRRQNQRARGASISTVTTGPSMNSTNGMQEPAKPRGSTLIHAFVAFLFLSYTKFSLASMFTLSITKLFGTDGVPSGSNYIYYAGHFRFSDRQYLLPYGILAILTLIFIVILPPLLLLGPIQFIDWLIDKRRFRWLQRVWPSITVHTFLDTFQGFYKPNRRFFSGIYFLFRLAVFLNFSFSQTVMDRYIFQQVAVMVLIVLVALFQPYKRDFYNYLDVLILFNLGILNALAIYIFTSTKFSSFPYKVYVIQCILVWLPLVYMLCYAVWNRVHHREQYNKMKAKVVRLVNMTKILQESGTSEEREPLLGNNPEFFADKSLDESIPGPINANEDPDEPLFRRASRRNRYRGTNQNINQSRGIESRAAVKPASVSSTVISVCEEEEPGVEKDLVKRDSGTSTGTGGSSRSGFSSNDS